MGNPVPDSKTPALAAIGMVVLGLVIAAIQGFSHGSIAGGERRDGLVEFAFDDSELFVVWGAEWGVVA